MKQNLRLATAKIAESGLLITTTVSDSHGRHAVVERINPLERERRRSQSYSFLCCGIICTALS